MKILNLKYTLILFLLVGMTACNDKDEFYEQNGSVDVKVANVTLAEGSTFFYDFAADQSATFTIDQGPETAFASAVVKKRINDGEWFDHATLSSFPATVSVSLDEVLDGTGVALDALSTSDSVELAFFLDDQYLSGHTTIPISCSTDLTFAGDPSAEVFSPVEGANATATFTATVEGPTDIETVNIYSSYNEGDRILVGAVPPADLAGGFTATLGDIAGAHDLDPDALEIGDTFTMTFGLVGELECPSANSFVVPYGCPSAIEGTYLATSSGVAGGGNPDWGPIEETVTLTATGAGGYAIDDVSFGMYEQIWAAGEDAGVLVDVCGSISLGPSIDQWDDTVVGTGTVEEDGTITISWSNGYGDGADVVLTPQ